MNWSELRAALARPGLWRSPWVGRLARWLLLAACLIYAFRGVHPLELFAAMGRFSLGAALMLVAWQMAGFLLVGQRLDWLCEGQVRYRDAVKASVLALGLNNIFPAKLGEPAKAVYLCRVGGLSAARSLACVFWERFFDVNVLLGFLLVAAALTGLRAAVLPMLLIVATVWLVVAVMRYQPALIRAGIGLVPVARLRALASDTAEQVSTRAERRFLLVLGGMSVLIWLQYASVFFLSVWWMAGLELSWPKVFAVFAAGAVGMAVPASPGSLGVFEAAVVFGLTGFGVERQTALALALVIHMIQYVPVTLGGVAVLAGSGLSLATLRRGPTPATGRADVISEETP